MQSDEMKDLMAVIERYYQGTYRADLDLLKDVFHEQAGMAGFLNGQYIMGTPEPFFDDIKAHQPMSQSGDPYHLDVKVALITGRIASVVVVESGFFGQGVIETHFHLVKEQSWKIVSKVFSSL